MARPIWNGSVNFGLVSIAVGLETVVRDKTIRFHLLSKDGTCRLRQKLVCPDTGQEFDFSQTARGYELAPGQYVLIDKKETDKITPERGRIIEIEQFVQRQDIDPIYFDAVYLVVPAEQSVKAYRLFVEALRDSDRVGLGRFVMRQREHLAALRVRDQGLLLHTLHFADEVSAIQDALPKAALHGAASAPEMKMARQLIEQMTAPLDMSRFNDTYRQALESIIQQKRRGRQTVEVSDQDDVEPAPQSLNLMEALKKSLESHPPHREHTRRKSA